MAAGWATGEADAGPALELPLHPPSESAALADQGAAVRWVESWRGIAGVSWGTRRWASLGTQQVPERLVLTTPLELARFVGRGSHWTTLAGRVDDMISRWGDAVRPVLRRHAAALVELDDLDTARLVAAVTWLVGNPDSGLYLRQLPVEGLSTKWIEARRSMVTALVTALTGETALGLATAPALLRVRVLDPDVAPPGLRDVSAPVSDLDTWPARPVRVVVVENLQTFLALPPLPGVIAIHGAGYAADLIGSVGWARDTPIVYWGDIDRDGFAILDRVRAHCRAVHSVLMDEETLLRHRHLWVPDPTRDSHAVLTRLTEGERRVLELTRDFGGVRLEQERLTWPACIAVLEGATRVVDCTLTAGGEVMEGRG